MAVWFKMFSLSFEDYVQMSILRLLKNRIAALYLPLINNTVAQAHEQNTQFPFRIDYWRHLCKSSKFLDICIPNKNSEVPNSLIAIFARWK